MKRIGWFCLIVPAVLAGLTLRLYDRVRFGRYGKYKTSVHLLLVLLACHSAGVIHAAVIPTGPAEWRDTVTGQVQRAMGPMGEPVLNYQNDDGTWSAYVDEWQRVGGAKIWKSVNGKDAVLADSTGAFTISRRGHRIGLLPPRLVKFNMLDSSRTVLATAQPDSVTVAGSEITWWGIFYGVNLRAVNNARIWQAAGLQWEFTQAARDSLAKLTPWVNRLLATIHRVDADSLGVVSWHDSSGTFTPSVAGRLTSKHFDLRDVSGRVWAIARSHITTADSITAIPVWKRVAIITGSAWFFEAFNPAATVRLPAGSLFHNAWFGTQTAHETGESQNQHYFQGTWATAASSGTTDSITGRWHSGGGAVSYKYVLYARTSTSTSNLVQCTNVYTNSNTLTAWIGQPLPGATITSGQEYYVGLWAASSSYLKYGSPTSLSDTIGSVAQAWGTGICPSTAMPNRTPNYLWDLYCTYTVGGGAQPKRRRIIVVGDCGGGEEDAGSYMEPGMAGAK